MLRWNLGSAMLFRDLTPVKKGRMVVGQDQKKKKKEAELKYRPDSVLVNLEGRPGASI